MAEMKDQIQELRFRKPWSSGGEPSPTLYMAIGAALAYAGMALYKNRDEVADFCSTCGAKLRSTWEQSGLKDKAGKVMGKVKEGGASMASAGANGQGQEPLY